MILAYGTMYAQNKEKISIQFNNISIENAIKQLDKAASKLNFSYNSSMPDLKKKVNKSYTNKTVKSILKDLFFNTSLSFKQVGNTIVITKKKKEKPKNKRNKIVSGYIYDKKSGETLIGASIALPDYSGGSITNAYGFYSITIPEDITELRVNYMGYNGTTIQLDNRNRIDIQLESSDNEIEEIVVSTSEEKANKVSGIKTISVQQIKEIPQLMGEPDIIKAIQIQNGIKTVSDGSSFYYVRGGNFDQNLVLLDEAPLYNPSHIMGLVSVINGDAIKSSNFYKAYFPAQYSGRLSSVLDVSSKDGNNQEFHLTSGISTIGLRTTVEGPIAKGKASYMLSLRKSWVDEVIKLLKSSLNDTPVPTFYDINAKVNWQVNKNNRLYASFYYGGDRIKLDVSDFDAKWHNMTATLRWNHIYNPKLFANTSLVYNNFKSDVKVSQESNQWLGSINEGRLIHKLSYYANSNNSFIGGIKVGIHRFAPGWQKNNAVNIGTKQLLSAELFVEHKAKIGDNLTINYGVNLKYVNAFSNDNMIELNDKYEIVKEYDAKDVKQKAWFEIEPRANINYDFNENNNAFISYSRMNQFSHSLYPYQNDFDIFKMWIPVSNNIKPMQSDIYSIGYGYASEHFSWGLEGYYKQIRNQLDYTAYPDLQSRYYERYLRAGNGYSYGAEFNIGYKAKKYSIEANYAYSTTKFKTPDVNGGKEYISKYDIPHQVNITGKYNISKRWQVSAYWKFASGKPFTLPVGTQMVNGGTDVIPIYGDRYNARFFNYHRLDLMFTLLPSSKPKKLKGTLSFGVMNAYGHDNPLSIDYSYNYTTLNPRSITFLKWFPMISYQIKL